MIARRIVLNKTFLLEKNDFSAEATDAWAAAVNPKFRVIGSWDLKEKLTRNSLHHFITTHGVVLVADDSTGNRMVIFKEGIALKRGDVRNWILYNDKPFPFPDKMREVVLNGLTKTILPLFGGALPLYTTINPPISKPVCPLTEA